MEKDKQKDEKSILRALITPSDTPEYDFQCIAVPSENKQLKYSYGNEEYFYQVLRTAKENISTARMESGLPIFEKHLAEWEISALNQLGISIGFDFTPDGIILRNKFGARADQQLKDDVKNGILKTVSIDGEVLEYSIERKPGMIPTYYAELWEPQFLAFAPVPQDIAAQIDVKRAIQKQIGIPKADKSISKSLTTKF